MATGGISLVSADAKLREQLKVEPGKMALVAKHVGKYGQHARARRAGIREGDVIVECGGRKDLMSENELYEYAIQAKRPGDMIKMRYLRNGNLKTAQIKLQ